MWLCVYYFNFVAFSCLFFSFWFLVFSFQFVFFNKTRKTQKTRNSAGSFGGFTVAVLSTGKRVGVCGRLARQ